MEQNSVCRQAVTVNLANGLHLRPMSDIAKVALRSSCELKIVKDEQTGLYDAHFGMILTQEPHVCKEGYEGTDTRPPQDLRDLPMNEDARCTEPQSQSSARGAQHAPRAGAAYRAPVVGTYDSDTGTVTYSDEGPSDSVTYTGGAAAAFGEDSWKWLLLQPLAEPRK